MMILQVHVREPLQQLLPVVLPLLLGAVEASLLQVPPAVVPPLSVPPLLLGPPALLRRPLVPVLLRQLRLVVGLGPRTELIVKLFLNGLLRRKPPLYGVQHPPGRAPVGRVLVLAGAVLSGYAAAHAVVVDEAHRGGGETGRGRRLREGVPLGVLLVLAVSLEPGAASGMGGE